MFWIKMGIRALLLLVFFCCLYILYENNFNGTRMAFALINVFCLLRILIDTTWKIIEISGKSRKKKVIKNELCC